LIGLPVSRSFQQNLYSELSIIHGKGREKRRKQFIKVKGKAILVTGR
jgi:hypothetical protein